MEDLSLTIPAGSIFGFLGPNGAGKTTTIRLLLGLLEPSAGRAAVLGWDPVREGDRVRARCGALLEHSGLYERLSAEDNLDLFGRIWHLSKGDRRARTRELLSHFGLWERRRDPAGDWSRGMKQKLAVARALLHRPAVLFLDEPTAGLDPGAAAALRDDLSALAAREGVTVFLSTHNLAEAEKLCDRVGVIRDGRLLAVGAPEELRSSGGVKHFRVVGSDFGDGLVDRLRARPEVRTLGRRDGGLGLELAADAKMAPLVSLIVQSGGQIEEVRQERASLEDVFLQLTREEP